MNIRDDLYKKVSQETPLLYDLWQPEGVAVVIGYSQKPEVEVNLERCAQDKVPIIRRRGGGGAVVLMPGVLCLTFAFLSQASISPYYFFKKINGFIASVLEEQFSIENLSPRGISDLAIGDKKVLGCSIFKSRQLFFYQGSLLVHLDLKKISRYLLHPSKEPDYRNAREHQDFVISLHACGYPLTVEQVKIALEIEIAKRFYAVIT